MFARLTCFCFRAATEEKRPPPLPNAVIMTILSKTGVTAAAALSKDTCMQQWCPDYVAHWLIKHHGPTHALIKASEHGKANICAALLALPGIHADAQNSAALVMAATGGYLVVCQLLLSQSDHPAMADAWNSLPLEAAANSGHLTVCELLLNHPSHPARPDVHDCWALLRAAAGGHQAVCQLLLNHPLYPARADAHNSEALAVAAALGHKGICELLLNQPVHAARPDAQNNLAQVLSLVQKYLPGHDGYAILQTF